MDCTFDEIIELVKVDEKTLIIRTEEQYVKNSRNADSTVAIEEYMPDLSEKYQTRFTALVEKLESTLPHNRSYLLEEELKG